MTDRVRAPDLLQVVLAGDLLGITEVLDDLERVPEREHLGALDVLDVVGDRLQAAVVAELDAEGVLGVDVDLVDRRPGLGEARLDLAPVALEPLGEAEVAHVVGVGQLAPHHDVRRRPVVERVPGRVRAAVLHGLEHRGHVEPDVVLAVPVDDSCDSTHRRTVPP